LTQDAVFGIVLAETTPGPEDEVLILVYNFTQKDVEIKQGERLAQGIFFPIDRAEFIDGEHKDTSRGGFGHSGGYNV
jgi:dUTPase